MKETVTIGGEDFTDTDPHARAIIDHLAKQGVTEQAVARTSYRVLVNMILRASAEVSARERDEFVTWLEEKERKPVSPALKALVRAGGPWIVKG